MTCRLDLIKERMDELEVEYEEDYEDVTDGQIFDNSVCDSVAEPDAPIDSDYLRSDKDVVISGPLSTFKGHGRRFMTQTEALHWAQDKYGENRVSLVLQPEGAPRWAILVKNLRS